MNIFEIEVKLRSGIDCMVYHKPIKFQYNGCSCKVYRYLEDALEEIQQYRAICTPEECRAAVEKQKEMIAYCDENNCYDCPYHGGSQKENRCMNDFIAEESVKGGGVNA